MRSSIIPGLKKILHGGDYNPDQWQAYPDILEADRRLRKSSGCNTFAIGIFAWTSYESVEGKYNFDWLDRTMDELAEEGNKAILATPSAAKPAWMAKKYPEIRRVLRNGQREGYTSRHNFCWSSPIYREKVTAINTELASRYKAHPALAMWHISNELAGTEGNGECHCPLCLKQWQEWLHNKYQTIDALNDAWWSPFWSHQFTDWDEINPADATLDGMMLDWVRFVSWQIRDWYQFEAKIVRDITPGIPITTNFMGVHPLIDYAKLAECVDVVADDQYPRYIDSKDSLINDAQATSFKHDLYRNFKPNRPFFLMESCPETPQWGKSVPLKHSNLHYAEMLQTIGHGGEGTCYFQWRKGRGGLEKFHGAVVDHSGREDARTFQTVKNLSGMYERLSEVIGAETKAEVALLFEFESRVGFAFSNGIHNGMQGAVMTAQAHHRPFWSNGIPIDVIASTQDFSSYKLVIAPQLWMLLPGVAERLKAYVENGGCLVSTYNSGVVDQYNRCLLGGVPGEGLMDLFGLWNEETDGLAEIGPRKIATCAEWLSHLPLEDIASDYAAIIRPSTAETVAKYSGECFYAGTPCLTVNSYGKGQAWYHGGAFSRNYLAQLYGMLIDKLGIERKLPERFPEGVTAQFRHKGSTEYCFLQNYTGQAHKIPLGNRTGTDMLNGTACAESVHLEPFGVAVLALS